MKLAKYIAVVIITATLIAALSTVIINTGVKRSTIDFFGKVNRLNDPTPVLDVVFIGSSRTLTNVDPVIIDSVTGLRSYNAGLNAATIKTCYNVASCTFEHQKNLKLMVLNIDFNMFDPEVDPYKDPYFYPYSSENKNLQLTQKNNSAFLHKFKFLDITAYDDYVQYAAFRGLLSFRKAAYNNGFNPHITSEFTRPDEKVLLSQPVKGTGEGYSFLQKIINECKARNIKLMFVLAPYVQQYHPSLYVNNYNTIIEKVRQIAIQQNIIFADYSKAAISTDTQYFYNSWHLNIKGAEKFSLLLANDIRQSLLQ